MAEQAAHDVVTESQSMASRPIDVPGIKQSTNSSGGDEESLPLANGINHPQHPFSHDHQTTIPNLDGAASSRDTAFDPNENPDIQQSLVNGHAISHAIRDDSVISTSPDATGGFESDMKQGEGRHERSNSIAKKPASFKSVSVTKNFLAKTGVAATPISKTLGEKPSIGFQVASLVSQSPKPRLVTKSWREGRLLNAGTTTQSTGAPDASKVWNRNKPTPIPPPKQFTDEELKQQYGIHLATRLQADEEGKTSKWADLDEEDEDWAPETVEWMDGTKSTILPSEAQAQAAHALQFKLSEIPTSTKEVPLPTEESAPSPTATPAPGKTILRPGALRQTSTNTRPGLVLRSVPETASSLAAKASAQASSKSPWAPLPPVDKASPISFVPPPSQQQSTQQQRLPVFSQDARFPLDAKSEAAPSPAREIAADDFDRSWRGNDRTSRELFDSRSGRYEPVKNARRPSMREEQSGIRPPSVLQRPSQGSYGQTEQSPIAQNMQEQSWTRGQSPLDQRHAEQRRESTDIINHQGQRTSSASSSQVAKTISDPAAETSNMESANSQAHPEGERRYSSRTSEVPSTATTAEAENVRVEQQRLMREKIEFNRKRKQEEEAREEAARKERIRVKMEALGPAPTKASPVAGETLSKQTSNANSQASPPPVQNTEEKKIDPKTQIHRRDNVFDTRPADPHRINESAKRGPSDHANPQLPQPRLQSHVERTQRVPESSPDAQLPNLATFGGKAEQASDASLSTAFDRPLPSWNGMSSGGQGLPGWPANSMHAHANAGGNVWGAPNNDKSLGNGAFEVEIQGLPSIHVPQVHPPQRTGPPPGPIAPPSSSPMLPAQAASSSSPLYGHLSGNGPSNGPLDRQNAPPVNIPSQIPPREEAARSWNAYAAALPAQLEASRQRRLLDPQLQRSNFQPLVQETFHRTMPGQKSGERQIVETTYSSYGGEPMLDTAGHTFSPPTVASNQHISHTNGNNRGSRFFGLSDRGQVPGNGAQAINLPHSPSPPPPDSDDHPAFDSTTPQPRVKLANSVKVKLPPATATSRPETVVMPPRPTPFRHGAQPIANTSEWQSRINGLLKSPMMTNATPRLNAPSPFTSPAKVQSLDVASFSRSPFDQPQMQSSATVSLPQVSSSAGRNQRIPVPYIVGPQSKYTEECLWDEPEFGSSPTVRLPRFVYIAKQQALHRIPPTGRLGREMLLDFACSASENGLDAPNAAGIQISLLNFRRFIPRRNFSASGKNGHSKFDKKRITSRKSDMGERTSTNTEVDSRSSKIENERRSSTWAKPPKGPPRSRRPLTDGQNDYPNKPTLASDFRASESVGANMADGATNKAHEVRPARKPRSSWTRPATMKEQPRVNAV